MLSHTGISWGDDLRTYQNNKNTYHSGSASLPTPRPPTYDPILCLTVDEKKVKNIPTIPLYEPPRTRASKVNKSKSYDIDTSTDSIPPPHKSEIPRLKLPNLNMNYTNLEPITRRVSEPVTSRPYRFDIIANQYLDYSDEIIIDNTLTARNTSAKYRKMKVYNPINNTYLSKDLEEEARRNEAHLINKKNDYHNKLQPMSVKNSEGSLYNITSVEVAKNESKLQEWSRNQEYQRQKHVEQIKTARQAVENRRLREEANYDRKIFPPTRVIYSNTDNITYRDNKALSARPTVWDAIMSA